MTTTLWIHPFNGIAGDMTLGALVDAGADLDKIRADLQSLDVDGWTLDATDTMRNGIGATNVTVTTNEGHSHRTAGDIISLVNAADFPDRVRQRSIAVFEALAVAEGAVHRVDPDAVHFHEVGGIDAIVDVVGSCLALEQLDVERIVVAPVAVGHGRTGSAHGIIPHPAPATVALLRNVPTVGLDVSLELTTPTGAALVAALADDYGPMPAMESTSNGFGAGDAELEEHPNLLHVILGQSIPLGSDHLIVIETNVDDLSGEYLSHAISILLDEGALDAWVTHVEMKKDRPAATVSALVEPERVAQLGQRLLDETGSLGYRSHGVQRTALAREMTTVEVDGQSVRVKISDRTVKAEYDDVAAAAVALGRPARLVAREAEEQVRPLRSDHE